ncbi:MAG: UDP-N-acetylmuramate--L-alanine ligase [Clostridia bacterium]|nr:UDP-N-acetylmuramate--L-alanine ligase [Clostridia bacterium]
MATENTHFGAARIEKALENCKSIFFIGIGGINMSSLAHISKKRGYLVGGSDRARSALTERLEEEGIKIFYAHSSENLDGYDAVVYTVAISPDNPEYLRAKELGLPCISRADYLGYIMTGYRRRIGISGMHGKSTCTSMCAHTLIAGRAAPTVLSGAELPIMGGAYYVGGEENFLFEACEYMDSFLDFNPTVAVVLNIEMDHVDYFKSMEQIRRSYASFASITGEDGYAVFNADDANVRLALEGYGGHRISFGIDSADADLRAVNIVSKNERYSFDVTERGETVCHIDLSVTGRHNIYNALAAVAVCLLCGLDREAIERGLFSFCGAARRMEYKGSLSGVPVFDDYGHHPTEVAATLSGAAGLVGRCGRLFCLFQPHTYSRTHALFEDFAEALDVADRVLIADIYAARETDTLGVSSELLARRIGKKARAPQSFSEAAELIKSETKKGDAVVVMGAGDIFKIFDLFGFDEDEK